MCTKELITVCFAPNYLSVLLQDKYCIRFIQPKSWKGHHKIVQIAPYSTIGTETALTTECLLWKDKREGLKCTRNI